MTNPNTGQVANPRLRPSRALSKPALTGAGGLSDRMPAQFLHARKRNFQARPEHFFDGELRTDCYAARTSGGCCAPIFRQGDLAIVSFYEVPRVDDFVVLYPIDGSTPLLKSLVLAPLVPIGAVHNPANSVSSVVLVETLSPGRLIGILASTLSAMHRVAGAVPAAEVAQWPVPAPAPRCRKAGAA